MSLPGETTTEWCAGLPLVQKRPLDFQVRDLLQQEEHMYRLRGYGVMASYVFAIILFGIVASHADSHDEMMTAVLTIAIIVLLMVGLPVTILIARDSFGRRKAISRDLASSMIKHFAGKLLVIPVEDSVWQGLRQAGLIPEGTDTEWSMDVLAASGRVWQMNGQAVKRWIVVQTVEVAATPDYAAVAAQWLQPVQSQNPTPLLAGQRAMSPAEREELRRYANRLWKRPLPTAIGFTLWISMPIAVILLEGNLNSTADWIHFFFLATVTITNDVWLFKAIQESRKMKQDEQEGYVIIVREADASFEQPAVTVTLGMQTPAMPVHELLALSRKAWTTDGHPTPWRMVRP